jgi:hypothetical protein
MINIRFGVQVTGISKRKKIPEKDFHHLPAQTGYNFITGCHHQVKAAIVRFMLDVPAQFIGSQTVDIDQANQFFIQHANERMRIGIFEEVLVEGKDFFKRAFGLPKPAVMPGAPMLQDIEIFFQYQ